MRSSLRSGSLAALVLAASCGGAADDPRVTVFAAASLRDALEEVAATYARETGVEPALHFGASGLLAVQLEKGARADVFFSAGTKELDRLAEARLVDVPSRVDLLSNQLVVVVPADAEPLDDPRDLAQPRITRLAIANPDGVPAGRYARAWLAEVGLWDALEPRLLPCTDVRATLAAVEHGGAEAGLVYRTDAAISDGVRIAYAVPVERGPRIVYPAAVLAGAERASEAQRFLDHLRTPRALAVFERHGFRPYGAP